MKRLIIATTATATLLLASAPAARARCEPADLEDRWALFLYGDNFATADVPLS